MKNWIWALTVVLFVYVLIGHFSQLSLLRANLRTANAGYLLLALGLEAVFFLNQAAFYASLSRLTTCPLTSRELFIPVIAANFLNVSTPTGTVTGILLIIEEAQRRGMNRMEAVLMSGLYFLLDYGAFLVVLAAGMAHLYWTHDLSRYELVTAGFLLLMVLLGAGLFLFALFRPEAFGLAFLQGFHRLKTSGFAGIPSARSPKNPQKKR